MFLVLDYVLDGDIPDISFIGAVVGGSGVNVLVRSLGCISVVLNGILSPQKTVRTFSLPSKSNHSFHKSIYFLSGSLPLFRFINSFGNKLCTQSASGCVRLLSCKIFDNNVGCKCLLKLYFFNLLNILNFSIRFISYIASACFSSCFSSFFNLFFKYFYLFFKCYIKWVIIQCSYFCQPMLLCRLCFFTREILIFIHLT